METMARRVGKTGPLEPHGRHASINSRSTSIGLLPQPPQPPLPCPSQRPKALKKVTNQFYNYIHVLLTITLPYRYHRHSSSFRRVANASHPPRVRRWSKAVAGASRRRRRAIACLLPSRRDVRAVPPPVQDQRVVSSFHPSPPPRFLHQHWRAPREYDGPRIGQTNRPRNEIGKAVTNHLPSVRRDAASARCERPSMNSTDVDENG